MKLDNEDQRVLLMQLIDSVPIQGTMPQVLDFAQKVVALQSAITNAVIEMDSSQEMLASR
jgi:hypothetical protein